MSGKVDTPHAVLSKMVDFLATARAQQARPRRHRPDKAGQKQARQSRPDVQKPPRLCRQTAKNRPDRAGQTKQAKSRPEASQEQTGRAENAAPVHEIGRKQANQSKAEAKQKQARSKLDTG